MGRDKRAIFERRNGLAQRERRTARGGTFDGPNQLHRFSEVTRRGYSRSLPSRSRKILCSADRECHACTTIQTYRCNCNLGGIEKLRAPCTFAGRDSSKKRSVVCILCGSDQYPPRVCTHAPRQTLLRSTKSAICIRGWSKPCHRSVPPLPHC